MWQKTGYSGPILLAGDTKFLGIPTGEYVAYDVSSYGGWRLRFEWDRD